MIWAAQHCVEVADSLHMHCATVGLGLNKNNGRGPAAVNVTLTVFLIQWWSVEAVGLLPADWLDFVWIRLYYVMFKVIINEAGIMFLWQNKTSETKI